MLKQLSNMNLIGILSIVAIYFFIGSILGQLIIFTMEGVLYISMILPIILPIYGIFKKKPLGLFIFWRHTLKKIFKPEFYVVYAITLYVAAGSIMNILMRMVPMVLLTAGVSFLLWEGIRLYREKREDEKKFPTYLEALKQTWK